MEWEGPFLSGLAFQKCGTLAVRRTHAWLNVVLSLIETLNDFEQEILHFHLGLGPRNM